jgi:hypothetical protein
MCGYGLKVEVVKINEIKMKFYKFQSRILLKSVYFDA